MEKPHVLAAHLPGDLRAEVDLLWGAVGAQPDTAAVERQDAITAAEVPLATGTRKVEEGRAVQKEIPALLKEQREAREVHLPLIDFGLGEVRIDREIGSQQWRRIVEEVEPRARVEVRGRAASAGRCLGCEEAVRLDVETAALRDVADAGHQAGVVHALKPLVARPAIPDRLLVLAPDRPLEVDAPGVVVRIEIERPEWNLDLQRPADLAPSGTRVPDTIPLPVLAVDPDERVGDQA